MNHTGFFRRLLSLLLCALLWGLWAAAAAEPMAFSGLREAKTYAEARKAYFDLQQAGEEAETLFSIAYVRNTIDTRDAFYEAEVKYLQEEFARMIPLEKEYNEALELQQSDMDMEKECQEDYFEDCAAIPEEVTVKDTHNSTHVHCLVSRLDNGSNEDFYFDTPNISVGDIVEIETKTGTTKGVIVRIVDMQ